VPHQFAGRQQLVSRFTVVLRGHSHLIGMLVDILRAGRKLWDFMLDTFNFCHFCMQPVTYLRIALLANPRALLARPIATPHGKCVCELKGWSVKRAAGAYRLLEGHLRTHVEWTWEIDDCSE
jgi:hypothetical protein